MSGTRSVRVAWLVDGEFGARIGRASLREGYSTEADLPKILGIYHGIPPEKIRILDVTEEEE